MERDLPKADASPVLQRTPRRWERLATAHKLAITGRQGPSWVGARDQSSWNPDLAKSVLMWAEYCVTNQDPIRGLGEGENGGPISTLVPFDGRFGGSASATGYLGKLYNPLIQSVQIWVLAYKSAAVSVPDAWRGVFYSQAKPTAAQGTSGQQLTGPGSFDPVDGDYGGWLVGLMVLAIGISVAHFSSFEHSTMGEGVSLSLPCNGFHVAPIFGISVSLSREQGSYGGPLPPTVRDAANTGSAIRTHSDQKRVAPSLPQKGRTDDGFLIPFFRSVLPISDPVQSECVADLKSSESDFPPSSGGTPGLAGVSRDAATSDANTGEVGHIFLRFDAAINVGNGIIVSNGATNTDSSCFPSDLQCFAQSRSVTLQSEIGDRSRSSVRSGGFLTDLIGIGIWLKRIVNVATTGTFTDAEVYAVKCAQATRFPLFKLWKNPVLTVLRLPPCEWGSNFGGSNGVDLASGGRGDLLLMSVQSIYVKAIWPKKLENTTGVVGFIPYWIAMVLPFRYCQFVDNEWTVHEFQSMLEGVSTENDLCSLC